MSDENPIDRFIESLPEERRGQARQAFMSGFLAMLKAEEIARERGKDPVGWAFKRLDFTGAPFPIYIEREPFCNPYLVPCRLDWWPDGSGPGHYTEEKPKLPAGVYEPISTVNLSVSVKRQWVEHRRMRYDFTFRAALACDEPDEAAAIIALDIVEAQTGFRPRVKSQRETFGRDDVSYPNAFVTSIPTTPEAPLLRPSPLHQSRERA